MTYKYGLPQYYKLTGELNVGELDNKDTNF